MPRPDPLVSVIGPESVMFFAEFTVTVPTLPPLLLMALGKAFPATLTRSRMPEMWTWTGLLAPIEPATLAVPICKVDCATVVRPL